MSFQQGEQDKKGFHPSALPTLGQQDGTKGTECPLPTLAWCWRKIKKHHERVHVVAVVLVDCFDASLDMWKWEEGVHTHGKYICIFTIECTREVHGLSSWQGVCLNKCQRAQKLVLRAEEKTCKAEMCVYMYVCLCVQERY